jgi:hypothetical protein
MKELEVVDYVGEIVVVDDDDLLYTMVPQSP